MRRLQTEAVENAQAHVLDICQQLEQVRRGLCLYGPDAPTCDCKYAGPYPVWRAWGSEFSGCCELRDLQQTLKRSVGLQTPPLATSCPACGAWCTWAIAHAPSLLPPDATLEEREPVWTLPCGHEVRALFYALDRLHAPHWFAFVDRIRPAEQNTIAEALARIPEEG